MFLVGDIGGTNTRLALAARDGRQWRLDNIKVVPTAVNIADLIRQYLSDTGHPPLSAMACCGAGPLAADGRIQLTNAPVQLEPDVLAAAAGLKTTILVNDFAAVARAIPELPRDNLKAFGNGVQRPDAPRLVIGPGTGLGVAQLVPVAEGWRVLPGEGGHADLAPVDDEQAQAWQKLHAAHGRVAAEFALSGPGLERLYVACVGEKPPHAPAIAEAAWRGDDQAKKVVRLFTRWLGSFVGGLALTTGALGGVYIAGGIIPAWGENFDRQLFREAFENKPPYTEWLRGFPSYLITHPQPGLYGLVALAEEALT